MNDVASSIPPGDLPSSAPSPLAAPAPEPTRRERIRNWLHGRQEQLEEARGTSPTVNFAFDAFSYDTDTGAPVLAAALAFRVFLFQVPYVCVFVIGAGFVADWTGRDVESFFHGRGVTRLTAESVSGAAEFSGWARFTALVLASYALFLSARSLIKVLMIVHALVWDTPRTKLKNATRSSVGFIALVTALVALSIVAVELGDHFKFGLLLTLAVYTVAPFVVWWFASTWLPHRDCPLIALAPGALLFAIGMEALHIATVVWFPHHLESKSDVYGTLGVSLALLLWAYLLGRLITLAAVLNAALWTRFGFESPHPLRIHRPKWWRIPFVDAYIDRAWKALFGDLDAGGGEPTAASGTEA
jgi:membrane protein